MGGGGGAAAKKYVKDLLWFCRVAMSGVVNWHRITRINKTC